MKKYNEKRIENRLEKNERSFLLTEKKAYENIMAERGITIPLSDYINALNAVEEEKYREER